MSSLETLKRCSRCEEWKDKGEFHKDKQKKDGLNPRCKNCMRIATQEWYERNSEHAKKYKKEHPEHARNYRQRNKEKIRVRARKYSKSEKYKERVREAAKAWYRNNPNSPKYNKETRRKKTEISKRWQERHPEKVAVMRKAQGQRKRAIKAGAEGSFSSKEWQQILETYNYTCLCCGKKGDETVTGRLTQDHIVPLSGGGRHSKENIQPLCFSCNSRKGTKVIDYRPN